MMFTADGLLQWFCHNDSVTSWISVTTWRDGPSCPLKKGLWRSRFGTPWALLWTSCTSCRCRQHEGMNLGLQSIKHTIETPIHTQAIVYSVHKNTLIIITIIIIMVKLMRFQMSLLTSLGFLSSKMHGVAAPVSWGVFFPQVLQAVVKVEHPWSGSLCGACLITREAGISQNAAWKGQEQICKTLCLTPFGRNSEKSN